MLTLANLQGQSLVPDITGFINPIELALQQRRKRADQATEKSEIQRQIDILKGEGTTREQQEAALLQLSGNNPQMANSMRQTLERGDKLEIAENRQVADQALKDALFLQGIKDPAVRQREITKIGQRQIAAGQDPAKTIALANANPDKQDLMIREQLITAANVGLISKLAEDALTQQEIKEGFTLSQGQVRFGPQGEEIARGLTKATTPSTPIGKARQDLKQGLITQQEFNQIKKAPTSEFKSSVGKLVGDRQLALEMFGQGSEQVQAIDDAIKAESKGEAPSLTDIGGIRKEFTKLSGAFITLRDANNKVQQASPTAPGDIALIFNFMKMLDPGSVIRESEFATAENAAGIPQRIIVLYNKMLAGEKLSDEQRNAFKTEAANIFTTTTATQLKLEDSFRAIAERQGMNPENVIIDFIEEEKAAQESSSALNNPTEVDF